jgi:DNA-binding GntR family transcriptional regulator
VPDDLPILDRRALPRRDGNTLAGRAYEAIRADIIGGELAPNQRLRLEDLRERFAMGFSPIREALMQLHTERLVVQEKMKGFRVAPISLAHLHDLCQVRIEIESLALRWAIERGDADWEADMLSAFHLLSKERKRDEGNANGIDAAWRNRHRAFHLSLVAACGSAQLLPMCESLFDQSERYVALSIRHRDEPRDDLGEHKAMMDATLARNVDQAIALCASHIQRTTDKVVASATLFAEAAE